MLTYSFEDRQGKSKFEYLYEQIREDILKGTLKPGEKLPSKRALAEHLGISVITVEGAYGQLLDEGYIISRPRSGFFVSEISLPSGSIVPDIPQTVELKNVGSGRLPREETLMISVFIPAVSPYASMVRMSEKPVTSNTSCTISLTFLIFMPPLVLMTLWAESRTRSPAEEI